MRRTDWSSDRFDSIVEVGGEEVGNCGARRDGVDGDVVAGQEGAEGADHADELVGRVGSEAMIQIGLGKGTLAANFAEE